MDLQDKVCIITGGGSGIGRATSELFTSLGAKVTICDINQRSGEELAEKLNKQCGGDVAIFVKCNVVDKDNFKCSFDKTIKKFGRVDILLNNAGIWNDSPEAWSREIDINFKGVVNGCLLAMEYMGAVNGGQGGIVVNTGSLLGLTVMSTMPIYGAAKAAVVALTRNLGSEFHYNLNKIRYMAVCPNYTGTELFEQLEEHFPLPQREMSEETTRLLVQLSPQKPESVAKCIAEMIRSGSNGSVWLSECDEPPKLVHVTDLNIIKSEVQPSLVRKVY